jgi:hypothetical protein
MTWQTDMASDAAELVSHFGASRTYRARTLSTFNTSTGARSEVTADTTLSMIRGMVSTSIESTNRANKRVERVKFSATAAALSAAAITPDHNDQIIDGANEWLILFIERKMDGAMYEFTCQRSV